MQVKVTLWWDELEIGTQIISTDDEMDLAKWQQVDIRLDPSDDGVRFFSPVAGLLESTYLRVTFEQVDSLGRRVGRR